MEKEELKELLQKYYNGTLDKEEEQRIEELLESFDAYNEFLNETMGEEEIREVDETKLIKKAQQRFFFRNTLLVISFILVIVPLLTMFSVVYYGIGGENGKGNEIIQTIATVSEMTTPNVYVDYDTIRDEIYPFTMTVTVDKYQMVYDEKRYVGQDRYKMFLTDVFAKESDYKFNGYSIDNIETRFVHPKSTYSLPDERRKAQSLPNDWPLEINISLDKAYPLKEIHEKFKGYNITWLALETGVEEKMKQEQDFIRTPAIGFPYKKVSPHSVFDRDFNNYGEVVKGLELLNKYEKLATNLTEYKDLKLSERLNWVKKQKELKIYGISIMGTAKDISSLQKMKEVKVIRLGLNDAQWGVDE
ncbi:sigma factor M regulator [Geobacillus sp. MR]|jgi:hypothetical protein|uniref:anti-sigma factor n=1 Tax=Geobacillus sp. MR TaxID=2508875 RepID=UPI00148DD832|nr:anti-sigma factor [Geobacillus sp. MR]NNU87303.1 sigma factor M regulator [Geobacillus sp. MR]